MLEQQVPGSQILVLVPQRTMGIPYAEALHASQSYAGSSVSILTVGGLAQRMVELFWSLACAPAGFSKPEEAPQFLTLETAQYYMAKIIEPLLEEGYFESVVMDRNRLFSQVIDNLNKAAVVGFPVDQISERLSNAWMGKPEQVRIYEDAQQCAKLFRKFCLEHNLLDFSLQVEIFRLHLWDNQICRKYLHSTYRHLIVDNIEEDTPVAHDLITDWMPELDSLLVIYDENAGYRRFLGADPEHARLVSELLPERMHFTESHVLSPGVQNLLASLEIKLPHQTTIDDFAFDKLVESDQAISIVKGQPALVFGTHTFFPDLLDWATQQINDLVESGVPPGEIAVLAPFISDALRFSLAHRLENLNIQTRTHRPSRSLREEPITHCLFTLAKLAHPQWFQDQENEMLPNRFDLAYAFVQSIESLDLVRAQLLSEIVYRKREGMVVLGSFDQIRPEMQERITYKIGERYEILRRWIEGYRHAPPLELDHFLSRLFGEILSQPGFGFHNRFLSGEVSANLIESIQKFRWIAGKAVEESGKFLGLEYLKMVHKGVIAAQYVRSWQAQPENAVLIAPAYTFLMANHPVDYQIWLDIGNRSWSERLYQPLTHPYVLSRQWQSGKKWSDADEVNTSQEALFRLVTGLLKRCRHGLLIGLSKFGEQGFEQKGPLLNAFQAVLRENQGRGAAE